MTDDEAREKAYEAAKKAIEASWEHAHSLKSNDQSMKDAFLDFLKHHTVVAHTDVTQADDAARAVGFLGDALKSYASNFLQKSAIHKLRSENAENGPYLERSNTGPS